MRHKALFSEFHNGCQARLSIDLPHPLQPLRSAIGDKGPLPKTQFISSMLNNCLTLRFGYDNMLIRIITRRNVHLMPTETVTQKDIARQLAVSQALVGGVLSGHRNVRVSAVTKELIIRTAKEMGYAPNAAARCASKRKDEHDCDRIC